MQKNDTLPKADKLESSRGWVFAFAVLLVSAALTLSVILPLTAGTRSFMGVPILWLCAGLAFAVQWLAFVPALILKTEHFYDLVGSFTYLTVILVAMILSQNDSLRAGIVAMMVIAWSGRLGWFLFKRIRIDGHDKRFDGVRDNAPRFLVGWTLQGLWVVLTLPAALMIIVTSGDAGFGLIDLIGTCLWLLGFAIEAKADAEKRKFRQNPAHKGQFIQSGLWAWSRHPNYFGEILIWLGIAVFASSTLVEFQWLVWVSPVFVYILLTRISGVPLLETMADQRWGGQPAYENYKARTPVLMMWPPKNSV